MAQVNIYVRVHDDGSIGDVLSDKGRRELIALSAAEARSNPEILDEYLSEVLDGADFTPLEIWKMTDEQKAQFLQERASDIDEFCEEYAIDTFDDMYEPFVVEIDD